MIEVKNLIKTFRDGEAETKVIKGIDFSVREGEFIAIMGRSGAGKSTLLYQMSLLDEPTAGQVMVDGRDANSMTISEKTVFRLTHFGYVFQDYALLPELTALENVALPLLMRDLEKSKAYGRAQEVLGQVGLAERLANLPSHLSGGEQQRVAVARAIANQPKVLFADEPTANLDNESSAAIMEIFKGLHRGGQTIIMVTHEEPYSNMAEKIVTIDDGKIISIIKVEPKHKFKQQIS